MTKFGVIGPLEKLSKGENMKLYHGSNVENIKTLNPVLSNHGKPLVYLTDNYTLAILYAHNPIKRPGGFFTYKFDKQGKLNYDEYFDNQLEVMYKGVSGYVYTINANENEYTKLDKMYWVYTTESNVPTNSVEYIEDLYLKILQCEKAGDIIINRYSTMDEETKQKWRSIVIKDIENKDLKNNMDSSYAQFLHKHFPDLI